MEDQTFSSTYRLNNIEFNYMKRKGKQMRGPGSPSSMDGQSKQNSTNATTPHTLNIHYLSESNSDPVFD